MVIQKRSDGSNMIAFGRGQDWDNAQWYVIGPGAFALTYVATTG